MHPDFPPLESVLATITRLSRWDEDHQQHFIATSEFGLPTATVFDDSEAMELIRDCKHGSLPLPELADIPLSSIHASVQGIVRADVLKFYVARPDHTYDELPSSWNAAGPLAVELNHGRTVLVDGTHRWVAAQLLGDKTFRAQVLRRL